MHHIFRTSLTRALVINIALLFFAPFAQAVDYAASDSELRVYEFPILDFPYNNSRAPSMRQSLQMSTDFYYATHNFILDMFADETTSTQGQQAGVWLVLGLFLFDKAAGYLPPGNVWMHEEWHRAALGQRGIDSTNNIYHFSTSTTYGLTDAANLKLNHPQDMARVSTAGLESMYEQTLETEKQAFFNNHRPLMNTLGIRNILGNISYMDTCVTNRITGGDCSIWVYDLFRPSAPTFFQSTQVLTAEENRYLQRQRNLSFINLIDPFLIGIRDFATPSGDWFWNANLRHELTPFGYTVAGNVFLRSRDDLAIFGTVHLYRNDTGSYPGIDVTLPRYPVNAFNKSAHITPRLAAWLQPENLLFRDTAAKAGGLLSVRLDVPLESGWSMFGELEDKSIGWVAANEYLRNNFSVRIGLSLATEHKARWRTAASKSAE